MYKEGFRRYREILTDDLKMLVDHYSIKDVAMKVVGVGSVGTYCAILLMMTSDDDSLFLQVKEARTSVLEPHAGKSVYPNHDQRVVTGQKLMQFASDMFLGWTEVLGRHYYIRLLRDIKIKPRVEQFDPPRMAKYAEYCGWALARAHAKSGEAAMISGYLGNSNKFDEAIASFAMNYSDQYTILGMQLLRLSLFTAASWLCSMFLNQWSECFRNYESCYSSDDYDRNKVSLSSEKPQ